MDRIGPYQVERRLGTGGMGTVYLARDPAGQLVAVKVIHEHLRTDPTFRARFAAEVAAARRVAGFCTARVLDADVSGPVPYLVSEYVTGPSLQELVAAHGALSTSDTEALAVGVAAALTAIHAAGVVHGDLTPRNVMLSPFGPKVIDFGIARLAGTAGVSAAAPPSIAWGTPGWVSPERLAGQPIGPAADVFCWGLLIAWAGTGRHPYGVPGPAGTARAPHGAPDLNGLNPRLVPLVSAALRPDPAGRPWARDLLLALCGSTEDARVRTAVAPLTGAIPTVPARTVVGPVPLPPARVRRRHPLRTAFLVSMAVLLACCVLGVLRELGKDQAGADNGTQTARDGVLEFAVTDVNCAKRTLKYISQKAPQGQFCVVSVRVTNIGNRSGRVYPSSQRLVDAQGREYKADDLAGLYHRQAASWADEVNPGNSITGDLVYDTPSGVHLTKLVVRDFPLSRGTAITLTG